METRKQWDDIFQTREEKRLSTKSSIPIETIFKMEKKLKTFQDKQKLRGFRSLLWHVSSTRNSKVKQEDAG